MYIHALAQPFDYLNGVGTSVRTHTINTHNQHTQSAHAISTRNQHTQPSIPQLDLHGPLRDQVVRGYITGLTGAAAAQDVRVLWVSVPHLGGVLEL